MARTYNRRCDWCGQPYEGRGECYCSTTCRDKAGQGAGFLWLFDVHCDPDTPMHPSFLAALHFAHEVRPDFLGIGGDWWDFASLSEHDKDKPGLLEGKFVAREINHGRRVLEALAPTARARKVFLLGNHEHRLTRWEERVPVARDLADLEGGLEALGFEAVDVNRVWRLGRINVLHGWYYNLYHARKHLDEIGRNCFYGHVHTHQVYVKKCPDEHPIMAMSVGCLCSKNPHYRRNRPSAWINSFLYLEIRGDGKFTPHHIMVIDGVASFGGQTFTWQEGRRLLGRLAGGMP